MRLDVITIFPGWFDGPLSTSLLGQAIEDGTLAVHVWDLREWARDRHRSVDGAPYGGGAGMIMRPDVWFRAAEAVWNEEDAGVGDAGGGDAGGGDGRAGDPYRVGGERPRTLLLTPRGRPLTQGVVRELAGEQRLVLCCGRYEGIDQRVHDAVATDEISIGDYVVAGGEVAAAVVIEAVTRLVPGVLGNVDSAAEESFRDGLLEYPQYTRPAEVRGMAVPEILRSGDHGAVARWRREQARRLTRRRRPDLGGGGDGGDDGSEPEGV